MPSRNRDLSALRITSRPGSLGTSLGAQPALSPFTLPLIPRLIRSIERKLRR